MFHHVYLKPRSHKRKIDAVENVFRAPEFFIDEETDRRFSTLFPSREEVPKQASNKSKVEEPQSNSARQDERRRMKTKRDRVDDVKQDSMAKRQRQDKFLIFKMEEPQTFDVRSDRVRQEENRRKKTKWDRIEDGFKEDAMDKSQKQRLDKRNEKEGSQSQSINALDMPVI